jgi:hypothetical protein
MNSSKFILCFIFIFISFVRCKENENLEFLAGNGLCGDVGERCSPTTPCCEKLVCSEFRICRS